MEAEIAAVRAEAFRVLVVEDDPRTAETIVRAVRKVGEPVVATTFKEALAALGRHRTWGALIIDVKLPDGDGIDILREARRYHPDAVAVLNSHWHFPRIFQAAWDLDAFYFYKGMDDGERLEESFSPPGITRTRRRTGSRRRSRTRSR